MIHHDVSWRIKACSCTCPIGVVSPFPANVETVVTFSVTLSSSLSVFTLSLCLDFPISLSLCLLAFAFALVGGHADAFSPLIFQILCLSRISQNLVSLVFQILLVTIISTCLCQSNLFCFLISPSHYLPNASVFSLCLYFPLNLYYSLTILFLVKDKTGEWTKLERCELLGRSPWI